MSTISAGTTLTTALVQTGDTTGNLVIKTNNGNTTAATFTTAGNLGIGTDSPNSTLEVNKNITFSDGDTFAQLVVKSASGATGKLLNIGVDEANNLSFIQSTNRGVDTNNLVLQRYGGNLLVGTTTTGSITNGVTVTGALGATILTIGHITGTGSGADYIVFRYNGTNIGSITQNGTTNTAYNTSSDYRLKENIAPMTGALAVVGQLKPCTYTWKSDGSDGQGFIAHELAEVVPDCVTGEKDGLDDEGNPRYQGIDTSFLVATLTAAIQEQQAIITDLKARIEILEAK
jgi:hypothetical protein